jgi:hypothetical protein
MVVGILAACGAPSTAAAAQGCEVVETTAFVGSTLAARDGTVYANYAPCASMDAIDAINLTGAEGMWGPTAVVYMRRGTFAPGLTPEADGSSEIEIDVTLSSHRFSVLTLKGARPHNPAGADDDIVIAESEATGLVNLNADESSPDYDMTVHGLSVLYVDGESGRDRIQATNDPEMIPTTFKLSLVGRYHADDLHGGAADDFARGEGGNDKIGGGAGGDQLSGGNGNDAVHGGPGGDELEGNRAGDALFGGTGRDEIQGDQGDDVISTADGYTDDVSCGLGEDRARVDPHDRVRHCEIVHRDPRAGR